MADIDIVKPLVIPFGHEWLFLFDAGKICAADQWAAMRQCCQGVLEQGT